MKKNHTEIIENNLFEFLKQFNRPEFGTTGAEDFCQCVYAGIPRLNMVFDSKSPKSDLEGIIKTIVEKYSSHNADFSWITGPSTSPQNTGDILQKSGFVYASPMIGKLFDLENLDPKDKKNDEINIVRVKNEKELKTFTGLVETVYGIDKSYSEIFFEILKKAGLSESGKMEFYYLSSDSVPVCTAAVFKGNTSIGIYWVGTVKEKRRLGFATDLMVHIINLAKKEGHKFIALQSSEMASELYDKIGFKELCEFKVYKHT